MRRFIRRSAAALMVGSALAAAQAQTPSTRINIGGGIIAPPTGAIQLPVPSNQYQYSRTSSFEYYQSGPEKGLLKSETVEPNNPALCVKTEYTYDARGNKRIATTSNCVEASGDAVFPQRQNENTYAQLSGVMVAGTPVTIPADTFATSSTNALGHSESRVYDPRFGVVTKLTGPNLLATFWEFDDFGRKTREIRADGTRTAVYYCVLNQPGDPSNTPGCHGGHIQGTEAPDDAYAFVHSEPLNASGSKIGAFVRVYTDRLGRELRSATESFDGAGQASGLIVSDTIYNAYGAKEVVTTPYFLSSMSLSALESVVIGMSKTEYDLLGRPTTVYSADPNGRAGNVNIAAYGLRTMSKQTFSYQGLKVETTNDHGQTRGEERNANGEVVRITDATGAQLVHQRDAFGNLVATKDALQNITTIVYDIRGRKVEMTDPDAGTSKYGYNALGELVWQQSAKQVAASTRTTMGYDKLGRLISRSEAEYNSSWTYDTCSNGVGKLCASGTSHGVTRTLSYDNKGRPSVSVTQITAGSGFSAGTSFTSSVSYDSNGRVASQTYPSGLQVGYDYSTKGFLQAVKLLTAATVNPLPNAAGQTAASKFLAAGTPLWTAQRVNAFGRIEQQVYGNGVVGTASFEASTGRIRSLKAGSGDIVLNLAYNWDSLNNLATRYDGNGEVSGSGASTGAVSETFAYDALNRLKSYTINAPAVPGLGRTVDLQYNALGMMLSKSDVGNYAYKAQGGSQPHALQSVTTTAGITNYAYDANGSLISASAGKYRSISYTSFNLPDSSAGIQGPAGGPQYRWHYDENHARILETQLTAAGTRSTWYLHPDNQGGLGFESETAPSGTVSNRHYISAGGQVVAVLVSTGAISGTAPAVLVKVEYWHKDHLGSLASTTDHNGAVTQRYAYDPFGKRRFVNGNYDEFGTLVLDWSASLNAGTDRGFTGHEHLDDVGLVHMNGRIYDPTLGRFMQADPFVQDQFNLQNYDRYAYCFNSPLTCTDPSGYFSWRKLWRAIRPFVAIAISIYLGPAGGAWVEGGLLSSTGALSGLGGAISAGQVIGQAAFAGFVSGAVASGNLQGALQGAFSGAMFGAAGDFLKTNGLERNFFAAVAVHGVAGCVSSEVSGGKCGSGALSAAFAKTGTFLPGMEELSNAARNHDWGAMVTGTVISAVLGGTGSQLGGGTFANGAQTGAFSYLFNEIASAKRAAQYRVEVLIGGPALNLEADSLVGALASGGGHAALVVDGMVYSKTADGLNPSALTRDQYLDQQGFRNTVSISFINTAIKHRLS